MSEQYPQQQPGAMLDIRPKFFPLAFFLFFFKPFISINGTQPFQGQWKKNDIPVPPGRYEVTVWINYLFKPQMGLSSVGVEVPPGAAAVVTWRAPFTIFGQGKIAVAGVGPMGGGQQQGGYQQGPSQQAGPQQAPQQQFSYRQDPQGYGQQQDRAQQQGYAQQQPAQQQPSQAAHSAPATQPAEAAQPAQSAPGGWHPDPTGRHQVRYYDGTRWTEHVGDNGAQATDPIS